MQDGRIYIERVNAPFLAVGGTRDDFRAEIERAIALGWLWRHESGDLHEVHRSWRRSICLNRPRYKSSACLPLRRGLENRGKSSDYQKSLWAMPLPSGNEERLQKPQ